MANKLSGEKKKKKNYKGIITQGADREENV